MHLFLAKPFFMKLHKTYFFAILAMIAISISCVPEDVETTYGPQVADDPSDCIEEQVIREISLRARVINPEGNGVENIEVFHKAIIRSCDGTSALIASVPITSDQDGNAFLDLPVDYLYKEDRLIWEVSMGKQATRVQYALPKTRILFTVFVDDVLE